MLGAKTEDEAVKLALIAEDPTVFFTTPHFDGYATVLVHLPLEVPARDVLARLGQRERQLAHVVPRRHGDEATPGDAPPQPRGTRAYHDDCRVTRWGMI